jgi:hypothetical protein
VYTCRYNRAHFITNILSGKWVIINPLSHGIGPIVSTHFDGQNLLKLSSKDLKKYVFMHNDLSNNFSLQEVFHIMNFVSTIIEIAKLTLKVLGQLAQQSMVPQNQSIFILY